MTTQNIPASKVYKLARDIIVAHAKISQNWQDTIDSVIVSYAKSDSDIGHVTAFQLYTALSKFAIAHGEVMRCIFVDAENFEAEAVIRLWTNSISELCNGAEHVVAVKESWRNAQLSMPDPKAVDHDKAIGLIRGMIDKTLDTISIA